MTQSSRPQAGNKTPIYGNPAYIDAGPWSRNEWAQKLIIEWVGDYVTTRGPFAKYLNRLAVTNPAGVTISVNTGGGYCGGSLLDNTAAVAFTPNTPGIAARTDKVVMVENNTNVAYTGVPSGVILDFPTDLTDYSGAASVPPYACRLAILRGDSVTGNATALIQSASYWMIELARFTISNVPAVSALTDNRDYVDAGTHSLFVPCFFGKQIGGIELLPSITAGSISSILLADAIVTDVWGRLVVPGNYISSMTAKGILRGTGDAGNLYAGLMWRAGACGEAYNVHNGDSGLAAEAFDAVLSHNSCHRLTTLSGLTPGDIVDLIFYRDAVNALDTIDHDVPFIGFFVTYLGWRVA
jgi:hypothetical protein